MSVYQYLNSKLVLFLKEKQRDLVVRELVKAACDEGYLEEEESFYRAVIEREKLVSTGIGIGIAIPHAKLEGIQHFFIAIGVCPGEGVEWKSLDGSLVKIVFLVGGPIDQQKRYLTLLSELTAVIKQPIFRDQLLKSKDPQQILELFKLHAF